MNYARTCQRWWQRGKVRKKWLATLKHEGVLECTGKFITPLFNSHKRSIHSAMFNIHSLNT